MIQNYWKSILAIVWITVGIFAYKNEVTITDDHDSGVIIFFMAFPYFLFYMILYVGVTILLIVFIIGPSLSVGISMAKILSGDDLNIIDHAILLNYMCSD